MRMWYRIESRYNSAARGLPCGPHLELDYAHTHFACQGSAYTIPVIVDFTRCSKVESLYVMLSRAKNPRLVALSAEVRGSRTAAVRCPVRSLAAAAVRAALARGVTPPPVRRSRRNGSLINTASSARCRV